MCDSMDVHARAGGGDQFVLLTNKVHDARVGGTNAGGHAWYFLPLGSALPCDRPAALQLC